MKKVSWILFFVLAGAWLFTATNRIWAKGGISAAATFREYQASGGPFTDRIRSDVNKPYQNNVDCVTSQVSGGLYFLRTVQQNCVPTRILVLDFTDFVTNTNSCAKIGDPDTNTVTLDPCGANINIPDIRFYAGNLFKPGATSTTVSLLINLTRNFHEQDFELVFEKPVCITGSGVMEAGVACSDNLAGTDVADLSQINETTGQPTEIGTYHMPFKVTVTEQ